MDAAGHFSVTPAGRIGLPACSWSFYIFGDAGLVSVAQTLVSAAPRLVSALAQIPGLC